MQGLRAAQILVTVRHLRLVEQHLLNVSDVAIEYGFSDFDGSTVAMDIENQAMVLKSFEFEAIEELFLVVHLGALIIEAESVDNLLESNVFECGPLYADVIDVLLVLRLTSLDIFLACHVVRREVEHLRRLSEANGLELGVVDQTLAKSAVNELRVHDRDRGTPVVSIVRQKALV